MTQPGDLAKKEGEAATKSKVGPNCAKVAPKCEGLRKEEDHNGCKEAGQRAFASLTLQ